MQTVQTLIRRRVLWRLICVYTVCQCPFYGTLGLNGLKTVILVEIGKRETSPPPPLSPRPKKKKKKKKKKKFNPRKPRFKPRPSPEQFYCWLFEPIYFAVTVHCVFLCVFACVVISGPSNLNRGLGRAECRDCGRWVSLYIHVENDRITKPQTSKSIKSRRNEPQIHM